METAESKDKLILDTLTYEDFIKDEDQTPPSSFRQLAQRSGTFTGNNFLQLRTHKI